MTEQGVLTLEKNGVTDYILDAGERSCWITIDNISIHIQRAHFDVGVYVDLYRVGFEAEDPPLSSCFGDFDDGS